MTMKPLIYCLYNATSTMGSEIIDNEIIMLLMDH